jgi:hypothetical protein
MTNIPDTNNTDHTNMAVRELMEANVFPKEHDVYVVHGVRADEFYLCVMSEGEIPYVFIAYEEDGSKRERVALPMDAKLFRVGVSPIEFRLRHSPRKTGTRLQDVLGYVRRGELWQCCAGLFLAACDDHLIVIEVVVDNGVSSRTRVWHKEERDPFAFGILPSAILVENKVAADTIEEACLRHSENGFLRAFSRRGMDLVDLSEVDEVYAGDRFESKDGGVFWVTSRTIGGEGYFGTLQGKVGEMTDHGACLHPSSCVPGEWRLTRDLDFRVAGLPALPLHPSTICGLKIFRTDLSKENRLFKKGDVVMSNVIGRGHVYLVIDAYPSLPHMKVRCLSKSKMRGTTLDVNKNHGWTLVKTGAPLTTTEWPS